MRLQLGDLIFTQLTDLLGKGLHTLTQTFPKQGEIRLCLKINVTRFVCTVINRHHVELVAQIALKRTHILQHVLVPVNNGQLGKRRSQTNFHFFTLLSSEQNHLLHPIDGNLQIGTNLIGF